MIHSYVTSLQLTFPAVYSLLWYLPVHVIDVIQQLSTNSLASYQDTSSLLIFL